MKLTRNMTVVSIAVVLVLFLVSAFTRFKTASAPLNSNPNENADLTAIRSFIGNPDLELSFVNTDLPTPYFRVGKVTKTDGGENMEAVEGWIRKVNVYGQKELLNDTCSVYEYHTDERNHSLTTVLIRGLQPSGIDTLKENGITCDSDSNNTSKIGKAEAETIAMNYLKRALPNFNEIKDQLTYTSQNNGESHEWLWEDENYQLPEGLASRPYPSPVIRISVYNDSSIQYWNTTSLFKE